MPTYTYRGFTPDGRKTGGSKRFATKEQMDEFVKKQGLEGSEVHKSRTQYSTGAYALVSPKELAIFCRQMSVLFFSHVTLMEGMILLANQTENKQLKIAMTEIHGHMEKGYTFAEAFSMYDHIFSLYLINMITVGETAGALDSVFARMADYYEKEHVVRKKLKSAAAYPLILTALMLAIVVLLIVRILPMFQDILNSMGGEIPAGTGLILGFGVFLRQHALWIILVIAALAAAVVAYIRTEKGALWVDKMKVTMPGSRYINVRVITSRFSRSLSILLKSGVQLSTALEDISFLMENRYLQDRFVKVTQRVSEGEELSSALEEVGVFPSLFLKMVLIGLKAGRLDEILDNSAGIFDEEVDDAIERVTSMIEPVLIIILSVIVGIILLSVMLPMISIMTAIG